MDTRRHWEQIYESKPATDVSWYQPEPAVSMRLIESVVHDSSAPIVDVGGGASTLVDHVLAAGYTSVTVLDISAHAMQQARARLGQDAERVRWLEADVLSEELSLGSFALWHDRAVFHFLTDVISRRRYIDQVRRCVPVGGYVAVATFAPDGPSHCSGLEVVRYDPDQLHGEFGSDFRLLEAEREEHVTPWGALQPFTYCMCRVSS
ncbi:MAG: class I SAM-dependent methyltransferase [Actinomycetota bacterium]